ncbi:MAG: molybdopterin-dependent oxidoreductase [Desulfobacterales bacterium]
MTSRKTNCVLCGNLCGLEVTIEDNKIVKARGDKDNLRSEGYVCRKGLNIGYHQHHADRLLYPLKKVGDSFERLSWDQAIAEIAEKLKGIVEEHGPRSLALMGGGTLGCPSQGAFSVGLLRAMGSQYYYNALAQELTGRYWADGKTFGNQNIHTSADMENTDMILMVGKNPMMSHHSPQARRVWPEFGKNPDKILVVIDPRVSETARLADIHLPIKPGTDALLYKAMIAIILNEGWQDQTYMDEHVSDFENIRPLFEDFDARAAIAVCELDFDQVKEVCRLFTTRTSSHVSDLGVLMSRHSTLISYLENVFLSITGRIARKGGNSLPPGIGSGGRRSSSRESDVWRTVATDFPPITGLYPPNVIPEEILNDHPDRLRAVIVSATNPLRSFADTSAYETAFNKLELLVTVDIAMTESAALSHYVLPARSAYESWDGGAGGGFPRTFMQFRGPVVEPEGEPLEGGEIFTRLADRLGLLPDIPDSLYEAADSGDRLTYGAALMEYLKANPDASRRMPYILAKTLGKTLGSVHLASLWGRLLTQPPWAQESAARVGFTPGPTLGDDIFQAIIDNPGGLHTGEADIENFDPDRFPELPTSDGQIHLDVPEVKAWLNEIDPVLEQEALKKDEDQYPFILSSGRHFDNNANTQMRDPEWNKGRRACTLIMHPDDADKQDLKDGRIVRVITEGGEEVVELEIDATTRPGYIMIPHGFGLVHQGKKHGPNANRLAKATHRDPIAGTPLHRYIRCRVEME